MRSTTLLASALATGALGGVVTQTHVDVVTKTVTVTVTDYGYGQQASSAAAPVSTHHSHYSHHSYEHSSYERSSKAASTLVASTPVASKPVAASSASKEATYSSAAPAPVPSSSAAYSPKPASSSAKVAPTQVSAQAAQGTAATSNFGNHKSGAQQADFWSGPDYQAAVIYHHNAARANHGAGLLQWDDSCANNALIAGQKCLPQSSPHYIPAGSGQGQNEFAIWGSSGPNVTAGITESWYKGELPAMAPYWGQKSVPETSPSALHLTQLIWKATTHVGCASVNCDGGIRTFCNYYPAGNVEGYFDQNVSPPAPGANLGSWSD